MTGSRAQARIAFFGLPGAFARVSLQALCRFDLRPSLVIEGLERDRPPPRDDSRLFKASEGRGLPARLGLGGWLRRPPGGLVEDAQTLGIDAVRTGNANAHRTRRWLTELSPDLLIVCGFHHLLAPPLLELSRRGGLNLHPGRLPDERGPAPLFWALKEGRTRIDWTLHVLDEGEDTGDVVQTGSVDTEAGDRGLAILEAIATAAAPALVRTVRAALDGDLVRVPQASPTRPRHPRPRFRDGRIEPDRPAEAVYTFVAGCAGRYPLFVESAGDRFFVADALSFDGKASLAFDYVLTGDRLLLRCQPGLVELLLKEDGALFAPDY